MSAKPTQLKNNYNRLLTIGQAAELLRISSKTLRNWDDKGILPSLRTKGSQRRYRKETLEKFAARKDLIKAFARENSVSKVKEKPRFLRAAILGCLAFLIFSGLTFTLLLSTSTIKEKTIKKDKGIEDKIMEEERKDYGYDGGSDEDDDVLGTASTPRSSEEAKWGGDGSISANEKGDLYPSTSGKGNLGTPDQRWKEIWADGMKVDKDGNLVVLSSLRVGSGEGTGLNSISGDLVIDSQDKIDVKQALYNSTGNNNGNLYVADNFEAAENVALGSNTSHTISFNGLVNTNILPSSDDLYDLGSSTTEWRNFYVDGIAYLDAIQSDSITLQGNMTASGHLLPSTDDAYDLGSSTIEWRDLYLDGTIYTDALQMPTGAASGYVLSTDGSGNATWTDVSSTAGPWTLVSNNLYPDSTSYNLALGGTNPGSAKLYVNGNVGIGTTAPSQPLHVEGQCVTGDTLLPIISPSRHSEGPSNSEGTEESPLVLRGSFPFDSAQGQDDNIEFSRIDEIKGGEYVLSLDEQTGQIVPARILALLDMGVKPVYHLTTEDGRTIRTTANHPYLTQEGWKKVVYLEEGEEIAVVKEEFLGMSVDINSHSQKENGKSDLTKNNNQSVIDIHNYFLLINNQPDTQNIRLNPPFNSIINNLDLSSGINKEPGPLHSKI